MKVRDAVEQARQKLYGSYRFERNMVETEVTATGNQITLQFPLQGAGRGSFLGIGDEVVYSWGPVSQGSRTVLVSRGEFGTTPQVHPMNTVVEVNPRFPSPIIRDALREEILSWPRQLYAVRSYQAPADRPEQHWISLSSVRELHGPIRVHTSVDGRSWREYPYWREVRGTPGPVGTAVGVELTRTPPHGSEVSVLCATGFNVETFDFDTELVTDVGLASSSLDLLVIGGVWRMMKTREIHRTFIEAQGDSRRAEEVPPTHSISAARALESLREQRLNDEIARLVSTYGWRQR